jgi:thioredoxin 1
VNHKELIEHLLHTKKFTLLYFWHDTCAPCKLFKPVVNTVIDTYAGKIDLIPVNVIEDTDTARRYGIRNVPSIVLVKNNETLGFHAGTLNKADLIKFLQQNMIGK